MTDLKNKDELGKQVMAYMAENKYASITKIAKACKLSRYMLQVLKDGGYIDRLPLALNTSQAGMIARRTSGWGDNFFLRGTPREQEARRGGAQG